MKFVSSSSEVLASTGPSPISATATTTAACTDTSPLKPQQPSPPINLDSTPGTTISTILFDCDNTLYPASAGIHEAMRDRIAAYIRNYVHEIAPDQVETTMARYYHEYGLALKGLIVHHNVDPSHYMPLVDGGVDQELHRYLEPIPELNAMLARIRPGIQKLIFTNSDISHVRHVLHELVGLPLSPSPNSSSSSTTTTTTMETSKKEDASDGSGISKRDERLLNGMTSAPIHHAACEIKSQFVPKHVHEQIGHFDGVIDITALEFDPKPMRTSYEKALHFVHETDPRRVLFIDDSCLNLVAAKAMGFITVLVSKSSPQHNSSNAAVEECADFAIESLLDLPKILPSLFIPLDNTPSPTEE